MDCPNCNNNITPDVEIEEELNQLFIQRVQNEVTQSCALPMALPVDRIPEFIIQAAQWFWMNDDMAVEERMYIIRNEDIQRQNVFNKTIDLPQQILAVTGVHKVNNALKYGVAGDFSLDRMMMSSYSMFGGAGTIGGGSGSGPGGFSLADMTMAMYEVDTFNQYLNTPVTFNYNRFSHKLVLLGNISYSDIVLECFKRCRIVDLYNNYYFFRYVVCLAKRALSQIYGMMEFNLPGGIIINYSMLSDQADSELDEIKEFVEKNHACDYFLQPNTI